STPPTSTLSLHAALPIYSLMAHATATQLRLVVSRRPLLRPRSAAHYWLCQHQCAGRNTAAEKRAGPRSSAARNSDHPLRLELHRSEEHTSELQSLRHLVC